MPKLQIPLPPRFFDHPGDPRIRWTNWKAQLDNFFCLTDLTLPADNKLNDQAKNAYLSSLLGSEGSRILMAHPVAATASTATYNDFSKKVSALFERPVNPVRAEFEFRSRKQGSNEPVGEYLTALRTLYSECKRPAEEEAHNLAMQLALGCYSQRTQEKLLTETEVNLDKFIQIIQADETAQASSAAIRNTNSTSTVAAVSKPGGHKKTQKLRKPCMGCGSTLHSYKDIKCPAVNKKCLNCDKPNHFSKMCKQKFKVNTVNINTTARSSNSEIYIDVQVSNNDNMTTLRMMIDTGSAISTLCDKTVKSFFGYAKLSPLEHSIHNFDGSIINQIKGTIPCKVTYKNREASTTMYVVPNTYPCILGRDLIQLLELNISGLSLSVNNIVEKSNSILSEFPNLTDPSHGTYPNYEHHIALSADAVPKVTKLRSIPLTRRDAVNAEIRNMEAQGIWSPVDKSSWQHAMVVVPKKDGQLRITTDLSPLNKYVIPDRYPLPTLSDILLNLKSASLFTRLDLKKAFYAIRLDEQSRLLTTTATPLGNYAYNCLVMDLTESSCVFQRLVCETLRIKLAMEDVSLYNLHRSPSLLHSATGPLTKGKPTAAYGPARNGKNIFSAYTLFLKQTTIVLLHC